MRISSKDWKNYIDKLSKLNNIAGEKMSDYVARHGFDDPRIIDYAYGLVTKYGEGSASLSAMMYDAIAEMEGKILPSAEVAETPEYGEVAKAINGVRKHSQNPTSYGNVVNRLVKRTGADTMLQNAERDGAEFAWVPLGDTCAFCIALASRGWQYISKKTLKNGHAEHIHANCDCNYTVRFDGKSTVAGYNPEEYLEIYESAEGNTPEEKINSIRAKYRAENRDKINAQKREAYNNSMTQEYRSVKRDSNKNNVPTQEGVISYSLLSDSYNGIYISDKEKIKPKRLDLIDKLVKKGLDRTKVNLDSGVKIVIVSDTELKDSSGGRFDPKTNTVFFKLYIDEKKQDHVITHELFHCKDFEEFIKNGGVYTNNNEYIKYISDESKKKLDKKGINAYNVGEISTYAKDSYKANRFDEVITEYRTKKAIERELK